MLVWRSNHTEHTSFGLVVRFLIVKAHTWGYPWSERMKYNKDTKCRLTHQSYGKYSFCLEVGVLVLEAQMWSSNPDRSVGKIAMGGPISAYWGTKNRHTFDTRELWDKNLILREVEHPSIRVSGSSVQRVNRCAINEHQYLNAVHMLYSCANGSPCIRSPHKYCHRTRNTTFEPGYNFSQLAQSKPGTTQNFSQSEAVARLLQLSEPKLCGKTECWPTIHSKFNLEASSYRLNLSRAPIRSVYLSPCPQCDHFTLPSTVIGGKVNWSRSN